MNSARSPTTLLDGVTFTMSPNKLVHLRIRVGDLLPSPFEPQALCLLAKVRVLPAGHLVLIHLGRARLHLLLERIVIFAHALPSTGSGD